MSTSDGAAGGAAESELGAEASRNKKTSEVVFKSGVNAQYGHLQGTKDRLGNMGTTRLPRRLAAQPLMLLPGARCRRLPANTQPGLFWGQ